MDDDVTESLREANILSLGGESIVGLRIVGNHDDVLVRSPLDRAELGGAHLTRQLGQIVRGEPGRKVLEAGLFAVQRPKVDHERLEPVMDMDDSSQSAG